MNERELYKAMLLDYPDVMDIEQVSAVLRVSTKTCYKLVKDQKLCCIKVGRAFRFPKVYLLRYLLTADIGILA